MIRLQGPKHHHTRSFHKMTRRLYPESDLLRALPLPTVLSSSKPKSLFFSSFIHPGAALFIPWRSGREADLS